MRRFDTILVTAISTLLLISICAAQQTPATSVPNLIRYSGTLKDAQGAALSSSAFGVTFAIYKQQDGGAAVWMETQNVTPDGNGQYNVVLGSTTAAGLPDDLFSQQEQRWLGVQVQGQAEQARVLLVSVPYAFKAHEAETLGGLPASAFVKAPPLDTSGNTGTDMGTAVNALSAAKRATISSKGKSAASRNNTICAALTANASANYIPLFDPTVCNLVNSTIYQLGSNVGIGTIVPSTALEVNGAITADLWYDITGAELPFLSIGWPAGRVVAANENTWLGLYAGGQGTGNVSDSGFGNTFVGYKTGLSNTGPTYFGSPEGSGNSFFGDSAGQSNTTGFFNSFYGSDAGQYNTTGVFNAFFGTDAGQYNTGPTLANPYFGSYNSFFGSAAGSANTTGYYNAFLGYRAGYGTSTGNSNTCIGYQTCYTFNAMNNTIVGRSGGFFNSGNNVTFLGFGAGYNNTADNNTFLGYQAGTSNTSGYNNTFVGYLAGTSNTTASNGTFGQENTFVGYKAGMGSKTSQGNTFLGSNAGLVSGSFHANDCCNTFVGKNAGMTSQTSNNTMVGYRAGESTTGGSNTLVGNKAGTAITTGQLNAFFGASAGFNDASMTGNTTGSQNTYVGVATGASGLTKTGNNNIFVGYNAGGAEGNVSNNIEIGNTGPTYEFGAWTGCGGTLPCSNQILIGTLGTQSDTYIQGIYGATMPPRYSSKPVCVDSNGKLWGGNRFDPHCDIPVSSRRFKEQILDMGDSSSRLFQLRPVTFFYKPQYDDGSHARQYGLIAEEVAKVYPDLVAYDRDGQPYTVKYQLLAPMLLNEFQKQHAVVAAQQDVIKGQQEQMQAQQQQIEQMQQRLSRLEALIATK